MLRIPCPYCGLRDQVEFHFGGEDTARRPANPEAVSDAQWADYLFYRDNRKGLHRERWVHQFGCRQWFTVDRDTLTHDIVSSAPIGDAGD
jgi:sarcosine oxidase subunit delta